MPVIVWLTQFFREGLDYVFFLRQMSVKYDFNCTITFFKFLSFFSFSGGRVVLVAAGEGGGDGKVGLTA